MRAHLLLPLAVLGLSSICWGVTEGPRVRASLDDLHSVEPDAPGPRHIRKTLDEVAAPAPLASPSELPVAVRLTAAPRRLFRLSLDSEPPPSDGRLIRLSLEDSGTVYGRLSLGGPHGRYVRTSLD